MGMGSRNEYAYKPGDRVRYVAESDYHSLHYGDTGVIITVEFNIGVRWDKESHRLHDLGGRCDNGHGLWMMLDQIEPDTLEAEDILPPCNMEL